MPLVIVRSATPSQINSFLTQASASANYLSKASASSIYLTQDSASNIYLTQESALSNYLPQSSASSTYLSQSNAALTYLSQSSASGTYLSQASASSTYLTQASASTTYLPQSSASSTYLSQASASTTYLPQTSASSTYLSQANAALTYLTQSSASSSYLTQASASSSFALKNSPAFSAWNSTITTIGNTPATVKIGFQTEEFDTNNNYDTTLSRFTPTVAGYYQINALITLATTTGLFTPMVYKNGVEHKFGGTALASAINFPRSNISVLVYANGTTDYFEIFAGHSQAATVNTYNVQNQTYFQAAYVRGI
jgi:hypothetical protein